VQYSDQSYMAPLPEDSIILAQELQEEFQMPSSHISRNESLYGVTKPTNETILTQVHKPVFIGTMNKRDNKGHGFSPLMSNKRLPFNDAVQQQLDQDEWMRDREYLYPS